MRATTQPGIEDLYREHALGLVRFALLLTGDRATAEDVVQDAFLGLHRHWDEVKDPGGTFIRTSNNGFVYEVAGGEPLYVSTLLGDSGWVSLRGER